MISSITHLAPTDPMGLLCHLRPGKLPHQNLHSPPLPPHFHHPALRKPLHGPPVLQRRRLPRQHLRLRLHLPARPAFLAAGNAQPASRQMPFLPHRLDLLRQHQRPHRRKQEPRPHTTKDKNSHNPIPNSSQPSSSPSPSSATSTPKSANANSSCPSSPSPPCTPTALPPSLTPFH